ncbi:MAG: hypothetical protein COB17_02745 [Sulfurimonas sp.]|nr:MAG: hypothetical protein COB17_02745 [Sulfurimonas sp.]
MKLRIISLVLSLSFLFSLTFEHISYTILFENSSSKTVEFVMEKRIAEKYIDDTNLISSILFLYNSKTKLPIPTFKEKSYIFKLNNTLFRPPILS